MKRWMIYVWLTVGAAGVRAQGDSLSVDSLRETEAVVAVRTEALPFTKAAADSAYIRADYATAISLYEHLLVDGGESAEIYYNLGNSYYKDNQIAKALLNLERASLLKPGDGDIRFNLEWVRSKTLDKITPVSEVFFVTWFRSMKNWMGADEWGRVAVCSFLLFLAAVAVYLFGKKMAVRKAGVGVALAALIVTVLSNVMAYSQKASLLEHDHAIIMAPAVTVKSTPDEGGTDLFILHEGHKVSIKDASMKEWVEIRLEDGNVGWIPVSVMETI